MRIATTTTEYIVKKSQQNDYDSQRIQEHQHWNCCLMIVFKPNMLRPNAATEKILHIIIANLRCQLVEVRTTRSDKTDTRRQASQENDDSQDNLTESPNK